MTLLHFLMSALAIPVGVWGLFHQGFKGIAQMAKVGTSTDYDLSNDTDHLTMLVDSGASGHYFDYQLHPGLKDQLVNYKELEKPRKLVTAGRHVLRRTATGTAPGVIVN